MDRRDFDFWLREAERAKVLEEMAMMSSMRLAMWGDGAAYAKAFSSLERVLAEIEGTKLAKVEDNWAGLKAIGRH